MKDKYQDGLFDYKNSHFFHLQPFFESLFTAPHGTYISMNKNKFIKEEKKTNQKNFLIKKKIYYGIERFVTEFYDIHHEDLRKKTINKDLITISDELFGKFGELSKTFSNDIIKSFYFDNTFVRKDENLLKFR